MPDELPPNVTRPAVDPFPGEAASPDMQTSPIEAPEAGRLSRMTSRLKDRLGRRQDSSPGSEIDPIDDVLDSAGVVLADYDTPTSEAGEPTRDQIAKHIYDETYAPTVEMLKLNLGQDISPEAANALSVNESKFLVAIDMKHLMSRETPEESLAREQTVAEGFKQLAQEVSVAALNGTSEPLVLGLDESTGTTREHSESVRDVPISGGVPYQYKNRGRTLPSESVNRIYDIFGVSRLATSMGRGHMDGPLENESKNTTVKRDEGGKIVSMETTTPAGIVIMEKWTVHEPNNRGEIPLEGHVPLVNQAGLELESEAHTISFRKAA